MKILISSSQNESIDGIYKESSRNLIKYLTEDKNTLVWGDGSKSIMGIAYEEFAKANLEILGYTNPKYIGEIELLPKAKHEVVEDTFELKKVLFNQADLIIILPGGIGTISELFAYIEEMRSNDVRKNLIIYDEYGHYKKLLELIEELIIKKFNNNSIYDYLHVAHNLDEFKTMYEKLK